MARYIDNVIHRTLVTLATVALLGAASAARATVITVTTTSDELNTDGDCSLREALVAANVDGPRDACPAGSSVQADEIVLADGAVYSLTLPFTTPTANDGPLVVRNDTPTSDLRITVAGTGSATISQDASPDTRVIVVSTGAHLDLEDVAIRGGATTGTEDGAGIFVGAGAQLALLRCTVQDNVSARSGGGIRNQGALIVEDSAFSHNVAAESGGAISNGSSTTTLVKGSFFANNEAHGQFGGGGAIESADLISIVESSFVNNRARAIGGAISHFDDVADQASISQSCFVGNEGDFSHHAVDVFNGSQVLRAAGNWWASDTGPSGAGGGAGDGIGPLVDFSPPANVPDPTCLPLEMVANGGFQSDGDGDRIPERWLGTAALTAKDGRACNASGGCVFKMRGNGGVKVLSNNFRHAGHAGDHFTFRARSRAKGVPANGGAYRAIFSIAHADGSTQETTLDFSAGKHGFERLEKQVVASEDYVKLRVRIEYGRASGVVRFDGVSLLLDP